MITRILTKLKYIALPLVVLAFFMLLPAPAHAAYTDNNIIDDSIFLDNNSMSQADIQNFLNSKGGAIASYSAPNTDPGQNNRMMSAAEIIYFTSQYVGINPRVIMATLQKEQSLITDPNPSAGKYNYAMGYGCPDSGSCGGSSGFYYQIVTGAWQLRLNFERAGGSNAPWTSPSGRTWGTNIGYACPSATRYYSTGLYAGRSVTFYSDNGTPYKTFNLDNRGTASMYCYTPHAYNPSGNPQYYSGSYNFVTSFESWWGSTHIPTYSYQLISQWADKDLMNMPGGEEFTYYLQVKNTGTVTWLNSGPNQVRLGATNPEDRQSSFCANTWLNCSRPGTMQEASVAPGGTANFILVMRAPMQFGYQTQSFSLVIEHVAWFNLPGITWEATVKPPVLQAQLMSSTIPTSVSAGTTTQAQVVIKNIGNATWYKNSPNAVNLTTGSTDTRQSPFVDSSWVSPTRLANLATGNVPPGSTTTFSFALKAPSINGLYGEGYQLVMENYQWFTTPTLNYPITVVNGVDQPKAPVYRLYNPGSRTHFYTADPAELDLVRRNYGFTLDGVAFYAYAQSGAGTVPVYRLYNPGSRTHFYTADPAELDLVRRNYGFTLDGVAFYTPQ